MKKLKSQPCKICGLLIQPHKDALKESIEQQHHHFLYNLEVAFKDAFADIPRRETYLLSQIYRNFCLKTESILKENTPK